MFRSLDQGRIIPKLNEYLRLKNRKIKLDQHGLCSGISTTWLDLMAHGSEQILYDTQKKIRGLSEKELVSPKNEPLLEQYISQVSFGQNPEKTGLEHAEEKRKINQNDLATIIEGKPVYAINKFPFKHAQLAKLFDLPIHKEKCIRLSSKKHTIAMYRRGDIFFLFDPNHSSGKAMQFKNSAALVKEIEKCLSVTAAGKIQLQDIQIEVAAPQYLEEKEEKKEVKENKEIAADKMQLYQTLVSGIDPAQVANPVALLAMAIDTNNFEDAIKLLASVDNLTAVVVNATGETALHKALQKSVEFPVKCLPLLTAMFAKLDKKDIDVADNTGTTLLHLAVKNNNLNLLDFLLAQGADVNKQDNNGESALHMAMRLQDDASLKKLLAHDPINLFVEANNGKTAIFEAVEKGKTDRALLLLNRISVPLKPAMFINSKTNESLLHLLVTQVDSPKNNELIQRLISLGLDVNLPTHQNKNTPLHIACQRGAFPHAINLLQNGASVTTKNAMNETPIAVAVKNKQWVCLVHMFMAIKDKSLTDLNNQDVELLQKNRSDLLNALKQIIANKKDPEKLLFLSNIFHKPEQVEIESKYSAPKNLLLDLFTNTPNDKKFGLFDKSLPSELAELNKLYVDLATPVTEKKMVK